jgi:tetratricopeptide (TPR) repeat protein
MMSLGLATMSSGLYWWLQPSGTPNEQSQYRIDDNDEWQPTDAGSEPNPTISHIRQLHQQQRYTQALSLIHQELSRRDLAPEIRAWLERQQPRLHAHRGWQQLQGQQPQAAIEQFERALNLANEALALKGLATAYWQLKMVWQAEAYARLYHQQQPDDFDGLRLLLEAMESLQDFHGMQQLIESFSSDRLTPAEASWLAATKADLTVKQREFANQQSIHTAYIHLTFHNDLHFHLSDRLLAFLEQTLDDWAVTWQLPYPPQPIEVILYQPTVFSQINHGPQWVSGLFDGRVRLPLGDTNSLATTKVRRLLRHELAHALIHQLTNNQPFSPWLTEGLAQFLECQNGCRTRPPMAFTFLNQRIFETSFLGLDHKTAQKAYVQSLFMVQYLHQKIGPDLISQLIHHQTVSGPAKPNHALKAFGFSFSELYKQSRAAWQEL